MAVGVDEVMAQRLRVQRLTSAPMDDPADVVRLLTCSQAQDPPLARFSLGMRTAGCDEAAVRQAIDEGRIVRTHILRPTWHYVAPEDLRWILDLTSAKVVTGMAARHRRLGLDDTALVDRGLAAVAERLAGRRCRTRRTLATELAEDGIVLANDQFGHLLMLAELRGLICSGPLDGQWHTYGLVDELVAPTKPKDRDDAVRDLVGRFFAGHGPAAITDLTRWTPLTQAEIKPALADLDDRLERVTVAGTDLWFDPSADVPAEKRPRRAFLLPVFDEAFLTYPKLNFPRAEAYPARSERGIFTEASAGVAVLDRRNVGWWKRSNKGDTTEVVLALADSLGPRQRNLVAAEADRLAAFTSRTAEVRFA